MRVAIGLVFCEVWHRKVNFLLSVVAVTAPSNGTAIINADDTITYTPNPDFVGVDVFGYGIIDGTGESAMAAVTVTVTALPDPPFATTDNVTTDEEVAIVINPLANDGDVVALDIPVDSVLSGTLEDGTPVAFSSQDIDLFASGTLTLEAAGLPAIGPLNITASTDPVPAGVRQGQTLQVDVGGMRADGPIQRGDLPPPSDGTLGRGTNDGGAWLQRHGRCGAIGTLFHPNEPVVVRAELLVQRDDVVHAGKDALDVQGGEADLDKDNVVTGTELGAYLRPIVSNASGQAQTPLFGRLEGEGEFLFFVKTSK